MVELKTESHHVIYECIVDGIRVVTVPKEGNAPTKQKNRSQIGYVDLIWTSFTDGTRSLILSTQVYVKKKT